VAEAWVCGGVGLLLLVWWLGGREEARKWACRRDSWSCLESDPAELGAGREGLGDGRDARSPDAERWKSGEATWCAGFGWAPSPVPDVWIPLGSWLAVLSARVCRSRVFMAM
jgi:hypothetical protein